MADAASPRFEELASRLREIGADVPGVWLERLLEEAGAPRWLPSPPGVSPLSGRPMSAQAWDLLVFNGLLSVCGGRVASARGRALVFELAATAVPMSVRGPVAGPRVSDALQKAIWAREQLRKSKAQPGDDAAACLFALESCGALVATPAMVEEARWRQGPGSEASDAQAIGALVADVLWHCHEDSAALLRAVAERSRHGERRERSRDRSP